MANAVSECSRPLSGSVITYKYSQNSAEFILVYYGLLWKKDTGENCPKERGTWGRVQDTPRTSFQLSSPGGIVGGLYGPSKHMWQHTWSVASQGSSWSLVVTQTWLMVCTVDLHTLACPGVELMLHKS